MAGVIGMAAGDKAGFGGRGVEPRQAVEDGAAAIVEQEDAQVAAEVGVP